MLIIRLQRTGKKNAADFRIVLAQKTASAAKKFTEVLGSYNPVKKAFVVKNEQRLKYWLAQHVEVSPTMHNLLVSNKLLDAKKVKAFSTPKKKAEETPPAPTTPSASADTPPPAGGETASTSEAPAAESDATVKSPSAIPASEPAPAADVPVAEQPKA